MANVYGYSTWHLANVANNELSTFTTSVHDSFYTIVDTSPLSMAVNG